MNYSDHVNRGRSSRTLSPWPNVVMSRDVTLAKGVNVISDRNPALAGE